MSGKTGGSHVGIDVVDLRHPRCVGKADDERFTSRILSEKELGALAVADDASITLWRLWAAKEAAYKVVSKIRGTPPPFVHATFEVDPPGTFSKDSFGRVRWEDLTVVIHWHHHPGRVAALAWNGNADDIPVEWSWGAVEDVDPVPNEPIESVLARLTEREQRPVHSRSSALVRIAARSALARGLGAEENRIEVVCGEGPKGRVPPEVLLDGRAAPADVSLSHHGKWLAWAIRFHQPPVPANGDGDGAKG